MLSFSFIRRIALEVPAGTQTTRWSVRDITEDPICVTTTKYIWVQHTTAPYLTAIPGY
jgi:hypothetical protein